jgi:hypothetical protein
MYRKVQAHACKIKVHRRVTCQTQVRFLHLCLHIHPHPSASRHILLQLPFTSSSFFSSCLSSPPSVNIPMSSLRSRPLAHDPVSHVSHDPSRSSETEHAHALHIARLVTYSKLSEQWSALHRLIVTQWEGGELGVSVFGIGLTPAYSCARCTSSWASCTCWPAMSKHDMTAKG